MQHAHAANKWPRTLVVATLLGFWLLLLAIGWWAMTAYGFKLEATMRIAPPRQWPANSQLPRIPGHNSLLVFLHPKCPCSRATVAELERLIASCNPETQNHLHWCVIATIPQSADYEWAQTALVRRALELGRATLFFDRGGTEATRFGAEISGTVILFDAHGNLRYAGGVTMARGHEGDNAGRNALARILAGQQNVPAIPAFGCRLVLEQCVESCEGTRLDAEAGLVGRANTSKDMIEAPPRGDGS